jgi:Zn-dependent M16 (insulinase) family peptidase
VDAFRADLLHNSTDDRERRYAGAMVCDVGLGFEGIPAFAEGEDLRDGRGSANCALGPSGIRAWRHTASGIRVVRFTEPGPLVSVSIIVGTVPWSDAGHPHTLEHIIFLGSSLYPERGYLDTLACRCLGNGTNAFTANEYTCYTASTAGFEGFSHVLPCLLDHVLRPRIDEATFASEVYHVRADGTEAGVVFSEMQAREHTEPDMMDRELRKALLQGTPLVYEAGGLCDGIRQLSNQDIQRYHQRMYCGSNVSVVIGGSPAIIDMTILKSIVPILDSCAADPSFNVGSVPWNVPSNLLPMPSLDQRTIRFPCVDEDIGTVTLAWRGPPSSNYMGIQALHVLLRYLSAETSSPLIQAFVMPEEPLASDIVYDFEAYLHVSTISLVCHGVSHLDEDDDSEDEPSRHDLLEARALAEYTANCEGLAVKKNSSLTLLNHADSLEDEKYTSGDQFETCTKTEMETSFLESGRLPTLVMKYLKDVVTTRKLPGGISSMRAAVVRCREEYLADMEGDSHESIPNSLVEELIYSGASGYTLGQSFRGELCRLKQLENENEDFWIDLLDNALVQAPRVEITMIPDRTLAKTQAEDEALALKARIKDIGQDNLKLLAQRADELLASVKPATFSPHVFPDSPRTENIPRIPYKVTSCLPGSYHSQAVSVETCYVHATVLLSTDGLSLEQRMCLPLLCDLLLSMDVESDDGTCIPYAEMSRLIDEATVSTDGSGPLMYQPSAMQIDCFGIHFAATEENFGHAADLILRALFNCKITGDRLSSAAKNADADSTESLRDGSSVLHAAVQVLPTIFGNNGERSLSNEEIVSLFGRRKFVTFIADEYSRESPRHRTRRKLLQLFSSSLRSIRAQPADKIFVQVTARDPGKFLDMFDVAWSDCVWRPDETSSNEHRIAGYQEVSCEAFKLAEYSSGSHVQLPITRRSCPDFAVMLKGELACAFGIPGVEGCYLDVRIDSNLVPGHADWAAATVLAEMLSRTEGPLYTAVRGAGFAYHVSIDQDVWRGKMHISVREASAPVDAWCAICSKMRELRQLLSNDEVSSELLMELNTAKSSVLFGLVSDRATPASIAAGAFASSAHGSPAGVLADRTVEETIEAVGIAAVRGVYDRYASRLLHPKSRLACLICNDSTVERSISAFRNTGDPIHFRQHKVCSLDLPQAAKVVLNLSK